MSTLLTLPLVAGTSGTFSTVIAAIGAIKLGAAAILLKLAVARGYQNSALDSGVGAASGYAAPEASSTVLRSSGTLLRSPCVRLRRSQERSRPTWRRLWHHPRGSLLSRLLHGHVLLWQVSHLRTRGQEQGPSWWRREADPHSLRVTFQLHFSSILFSQSFAPFFANGSKKQASISSIVTCNKSISSRLFACKSFTFLVPSGASREQIGNNVSNVNQDIPLKVKLR